MNLSKALVIMAVQLCSTSQASLAFVDLEHLRVSSKFRKVNLGLVLQVHRVGFT